MVALIHVWRLYRSAHSHNLCSSTHLHFGACILAALESWTYSIIGAVRGLHLGSGSQCASLGWLLSMMVLMSLADGMKQLLSCASV